jgi:hypothetical protein
MAARKTARKKPAKRGRKPVVVHVKAGETLVVYRVKNKRCAAKKPKKAAKKKPKKAAKKPKTTTKKDAARHTDGFAGWA